MKLELIGSPLSPHVQQCVALLLHQQHNFQFVPLYENPTPDWYLRLSPSGAIPGLRLNDEVLFTSSPIIMEYLSDVNQGALQPRDPLQRAQQRMFRQAADEFCQYLTTWLESPSEDSFLRAQENFFQALRLPERYVRGPYFAGLQPSLVDFAWAPIMSRLQFIENRGILESYWNRHPEFYTWYLAMTEKDWFEHSVPRNFDELLAAHLKVRQAWVTQIANELVLR